MKRMNYKSYQAKRREQLILLLVEKTRTYNDKNRKDKKLAWTEKEINDIRFELSLL